MKQASIENTVYYTPEKIILQFNKEKFNLVSKNQSKFFKW